MTIANRELNTIAAQEYRYGFVTDIEADVAPKGLNEDIVRWISAKKDEPDFMLRWRLQAFRHWQKLEADQQTPTWAEVHYPPIDYQDIIYYSAPKAKEKLQSLDEVDPELLRTYEKLGIPLEEQKRLAGVAVDAIFDSVSIATTFREELAKHGIIFCSFSEALQEHPHLIQKYLGSVVPYSDNFYAALNAAVFSDGSFCYIPKGVRCPLELTTYFRINTAETGQFERTLIIAEEGSYVSYLEGCSAPMRDENQLHAAVVELVAHKDAEIKYSTIQNWYPGDENGKGGIYNFVTKRGKCAGANSKISWTQVENRLRHHLEVPQRHPPGRRLHRRVLLRRPHQGPPAGRHRHQDGAYRQEHPQQDYRQGHLRRPRQQHLPRPRSHRLQGRQRPQLHPVRFPPHRRQVRRSHHPLRGSAKQHRPLGA